jgi:hypothetical protein
LRKQTILRLRLVWKIPFQVAPQEVLRDDGREPERKCDQTLQEGLNGHWERDPGRQRLLGAEAKKRRHAGDCVVASVDHSQVQPHFRILAGELD